MKENKFQSTFVAFKHRNYQLWFAGQSVSLFGTWMQSTAQAMLIYQLTKSSVYLGYAGFAFGIPAIFMLYGGVIADRFPKRTLMILTQTVMMILAFILAGLTYAHIVKPWHIILLAFLLGITNSIDAPVRLAFMPEIVEKEDLANAVAANTTMVHLATTIGPPIGMFIFAKFGSGLCFLLNGISFIAVIIALAMMKLIKVPKLHLSSSTHYLLKEGLSYVFHNRTILSLMILTATASLFGISSATLFPIWADKVLQGNKIFSLNGSALINGWLLSARGLGSLLVAMYIVSLGRFRYKGRLVTIGMICFPIFLFLFAFTRWFPASLLFTAIAGFFLIMTTSLSNALCMTISPTQYRGRVMSIYSLAFFGAMPIGALFIGWLAQPRMVNAPGAIIVCSIIFCIIVGFILLFSPKIQTLE